MASQTEVAEGDEAAGGAAVDGEIETDDQSPSQEDLQLLHPTTD